MMAAATLASLGPGALRAWYVFVFLPAADAHPQRLAALLPPELGTPDPATASAALRRALDLDDAPGFDPAQPAHRAAALPAPGLALLAWRLGLALAAPLLRGLIRQADLQALGDALSPDDWQFVFDPAARLEGAPAALPADVPLGRLPAACRDWGCAVLEAAAQTLPPGVGERLRLRLPPQAPPIAAPAQRCRRWVEQLYPQVAQESHPGWDAEWSPQAG